MHLDSLAAANMHTSSAWTSLLPKQEYGTFCTCLLCHHQQSLKSRGGLNSQLSPCHFFPDTQTLQQSASEYTPERLGHFLEEIGLGDHVATFIEQEISGDMLLEDEAIDEMLEELGVESAIEKLKIKVFAIVQGFEFVILVQNHWGESGDIAVTM